MSGPVFAFRGTVHPDGTCTLSLMRYTPDGERTSHEEAVHAHPEDALAALWGALAPKPEAVLVSAPLTEPAPPPEPPPPPKARKRVR